MGLSSHKAGPIKSCWTAYDKLSRGGEVKWELGLLECWVWREKMRLDR